MSALAQAYGEAGRFDDVVRVCRTGLRDYPGQARVYLVLGRALAALGKLATAKQVLLQAMAIDPNSRDAVALLGEVLLRRGERAEALELLQRARERWPDDGGLRRLQSQVHQVRSEDGPSPAARPPRAAPSREHWFAVQGAWEDVLEANVERPPEEIADIPDLAVDPAAIELDLPPLADPLALGMPPLPDDADWSPSKSDADGLEMEVRQRPLAAASPDVSRTDVDSAAAVAPAQPPVSQFVPPVGPRVAVRSVDSVAETQVPGPPVDPLAESLVAAEPAGDGLGLPIVENSSQADAEILPSISFVDEDLLARLPDDGESATTSPIDGSGRSRRVRVWVLTLVAVFTLVSTAACVAWWVLSGRAVDDAIEISRAARLSGSRRSLNDALEHIRAAWRYRREQARLADEASLLRATAVLLYGVRPGGDLPPVSGGDWYDRTTRAALALATNDIDAAAAELASGRPDDPADRQFHQLLSAWVAWSRGKTREAMAILTGPQFGNDVGWRQILSAFIRIERGELGQAEQLLRAVVLSDPDWRLPQLTLALVLSRQGVTGKDVDTLIDAAVAHPVGLAFQRIAQLERALRRSTLEAPAAAEALVRILREVPFRRTIVDLTIGDRARLCRFDLAREQLERLAPKATGGDGMAWLRVELALLAGLDSQALALLPGQPDGPRSGLLAIRVRLYARQLDETRALLAAATGPPQLVEALSAYLGESKTVASSLPSTQVALTLAAAGVASDDPALALRLTHPLRDDPVFGLRARLISARALLAQGKRADALREAEGATDRCPGFAAAQELVGLLYLEQGSYGVAAAAFHAAAETGATTPGLLSGHARALAGLSRAEPAKRLLARAQAAGASVQELALARAELALAAQQPSACREVLATTADDRLAARVLRARCLAAEGQLAEAELVLLEMRRSMPDQPLPALLLGLLLQQQESPTARKWLEEAVVLARGERLYRRILARANLALARESTHRGRPTARSFDWLASAIRADETYVEPFVQLGRWRLTQHRLADALRALDRAVELDPHDATAHYFRAVAQSSDPAAQRRSYETFLQLEAEGVRADAARLALSRLH